MTIDYSLYLVTDSSAAMLRDRNLVDIVDKALDGGVSIVQFRDKLSSTKDLILQARRLHSVTRTKGVPLLINDRIDVALAVGAEGVHIGQDDMDIVEARRLLGSRAIIGVTCHNVRDAVSAIKNGANYLGIGTLYATSTKPDATNIIGTSGCKSILESISAIPYFSSVRLVAIGGINASNVQEVLSQSKTANRSLDGVAVVSAIIAAENPSAEAARLRSLLENTMAPPKNTAQASADTIETLFAKIPNVTRALAEQQPLCHNMTNLVVQNFAANILLSIGAKPIMANDGSEAKDLAQLHGSLSINIGSASDNSITHCLRALKAYNRNGGPTLFDPVGAGATSFRREAVNLLLSGGHFDVIKGNESEIQVVLGNSQPRQQRGVDSDSCLETAEKVKIVEELATRERSVVVMTGKVDVVSDGNRTFLVKNGDPLLGTITGSGCALGSTIGAYLAVSRDNPLLASIAGLLHYEIAAEMASSNHRVNGPGTFLPVFMDCLNHIKEKTIQNDDTWLTAARVESFVS